MSSPSYMELSVRGRLEKRIEEALKRMENCELCPRQCRVDRLRDEKGFCNTGRKARVASYNSHFGEESPLVGRYGSGTIFISSCNLQCIFCQNYDISHGNEGMYVEPEQMAEMMIELQDRGCHNINFVTPTHVVPQILEALGVAVRAGLRIPLIYNSSGYDKRETLQLLEGIIDIYMPDFKFWDEKWADRFCRAPDYGHVAKEAIKEMHRQVGDLILDESGVAQKGLLVRHLVMPNKIAGTREIMRFLAQCISVHTYVNVMDQYRPCGEAYTDEFINRRLKSKEFREAVSAAKEEGLNRLDKRDVIRILFSQ